MNLIDWILNVAGLFLWIDWRSGRALRHAHSVLSLASTVRPAERRIATGFGSPAVLIFLLLVRPCFYFSLGSKLEWTPTLDLFAISLPWRSDLLDRMYLYSTLSFLLTLGSFYAVVLLLSAVNRKLPDSEVIQQFVRVQLGWLERLPWWLKLLLPSLAAAFAWVGGVPLLQWIGSLPATTAPRAIWAEALAFALSSLLAWKWFLIALFALHLLNIYVYLGTHPIWSYISVTARKLLWPVSFLSFPKLDLAPLAGIALVFFLAEFAIKPAVIHLLQRFAV